MDFSAILAAHGTPEPERQVRPQLWALILAVLLLMVVAVSLLGKNTQGGDDVTPTPTPEHDARVYTVTYGFGIFSPTNLRIHAGDTVRFRNDSTNPVRIIADALPGRRLPEFDSVGPVQPGATFGYTFAVPGTFTYRNQANAAQVGVIIVR